MDAPLFGLLGIIGLLVLMALRVPIAISFALAGFLGTWYLVGLQPAFTTLATVPWETASHYSLITIPMFVLMGEFTYFSGISKELFDAVGKWMGHLPGGLAIATVWACAGFAAACGSSVASAATMGTIALPEMKKYQYDRRLATGVVAAGGTLGILIPPSTGFIIYGVITETSIGKLFIAGIIPGIMLATLFALTVYIWVRRNPALALPVPRASWGERFGVLKGVWAVVLLFLLVMGGIYAGVFSPIEAGGVGAFGAFLLTIGKRRLSRSNLSSALLDTMHSTCMIFAIIIGAMIFNYFLAVSRLPMELSEAVAGLAVPRYVILFIILAVHIVLGAFMDALAMIILSMPIVFPIILALGFDPVWFGVIVVLIIEMALITPPVGMNVYVLSGVAPDVPLEDVFRGIFPLLLAMIVALAIVAAFPQLSLFLPSLMIK